MSLPMSCLYLHTDGGVLPKCFPADPSCQAVQGPKLSEKGKAKQRDMTLDSSYFGSSDLT